jgi:hypothetical protein
MNFNWGKGIFLVIVLFLGACLAFIIYSRTQKWSLVEEDYYPKELRHEEVLVKMRNFTALQEPMLFQVSQGSLSIKFPPVFKGLTLSGQIHVYRPSDEGMDCLVPIKADTSLIQIIPKEKFQHGKYVIKVDWIAAGKSYYKEQEVFIP